MRIKLLDRLREGDATVTELKETLGAVRSNVSKRVGILHHAGMVIRVKEGTHARYAIAADGVFELCEQVYGGRAAGSKRSTSSCGSTHPADKRAVALSAFQDCGAASGSTAKPGGASGSSGPRATATAEASSFRRAE